jgi:hypothetical protein
LQDATDRVIERLVKSAGPVRRLRPPGIRAALWLLAVAALGALAIFLFSDRSLFARRANDPKLDLELAGTLLTGVVAVVAAFYLSLPDRSPLWALLPLPPLALWIVSSGYSCYQHWIRFGPDGWEIGESAQCFRFILAVGVPLGISLLVLLRRSRPLSPTRVAVVAGLGVAALAAFLLQFFHPFDVTFMDLSVHLVAIGIVVTISTLVGRVPDS